jgi:hypothetical protein
MDRRNIAAWLREAGALGLIDLLDRVQLAKGDINE